MSNESSFDDDNEFSLSDPLKLHRKLVSLSLKQIQKRVGSNLLRLVNAFLLEIQAATAIGARDQAPLVQTWERWSPFIRKKAFMDQLESEIARAEQVQQECHDIFNMIRAIAHDLHDMSEKELKDYFETRKNPEKESKAIMNELALDEFKKARATHHEGNLVGARIHYQRAIDVFAQTENDAMLAASKQNLGNVLREDGQLPQAETLYREAATISERIGDTVNLTLALANLGYLMLARRDLESAHQAAMRGLKIAKLNEPDTNLKNLSLLLLEIADALPVVESVDRYQEIIQTFSEPGLKEDLGRAYLLLGRKLSYANQFEESCEAALKGLKLLLEVKATPELIQWAATLHRSICIVAGRTQDEINRIQDDVFRIPGPVARLGDFVTRSLTRDVYDGKLSLDEACRLLRKEHKREPFAIEAIAVLCEDLRRAIWVNDEEVRILPTGSIRMFEINHQLLILAADLAEAQKTSSSLHLNLGVIYDQMGRYRDAAQTFAQGARLARLTGNIVLFLSMRLNSSQALQRAGDLPGAIKDVELLLTEIKGIDKGTQHPDDYPRVCLDLVNLYRRQNQLQEAEATALTGLQAVNTLHETDPVILSRLQTLEAGFHGLLGVICKQSDRYVSAENHFQRCLEIAIARHDRDDEARALANLAGVSSDVGNRDEALRLYNQAYQRIEKSPRPVFAFIYTDRAVTLSFAGEIAEARRMALLALEMQPTSRQAAKCVAVLLRTATNETERSLAEQQAEQLLASDPSPEIQEIILSQLLHLPTATLEQKYKWKTQLRQTADTFAGLQGAYSSLYVAAMLDSLGADRKAAIEYLQRCLRLIDEAAGANPDRDTQRHIFNTGNKAAQHLLQLIPADNAAGLEIVLRTKARATFNQRFTPAYTVEELGKQLSQQPQPTLLVEMYMLPAETLLYFVTADGLQGVEHITRIPDTPPTDFELLGKLGDFLVHQKAWSSETWSHLSDAFTSSVSKYLQPNQVICLIPAGPWHFLPLHACLLDGRPLIETHPVYYGASSAILSNPGNAKRRVDSCLSVGVEFEEEAAWVADWFESKLAFLGPMAYPEAVLRMISKVDLVHFSCHGSYNPLSGEESGVLLGYQSWLTPALIEGGTTDADLIMISACESAFDFVTAANDMVGLDQAFLNMGAASVLGTLWPVDAEATEIFVKAFYENLTGVRGSKVKQISKAHALQAAVAQLRSDSHFEHPFYWAPFKLTGGWW